MSRPIMIVAGGTGGHVFPGLAVAAELQKRAQEVVWLGTREGIEATAVAAAGIPIEWIQVTGLRGRGLLALPIGVFKLLKSTFHAVGILRRQRPKAVLGFGGFVSGPGGLAARLCRCRLLVHEQNAVAGTANRLLSRFAERVFETYRGSFGGKVDAICVGNPVRESLLGLEDPAERFARARARGGPRRVLVLGGSQGSRALNEKIPRLVGQMAEQARPDLLHQSGRSADIARAAYERAGVIAEVVPFIEDMSAAYLWADLVICRSGATTLAELAAVGVGAVLVPFPYAIDDHQRLNAQRFAEAGAAQLLSESECDAAASLQLICDLLADYPRLEAMALAARQLAAPDAAAKIVDACLEDPA